MQLDLNLLTALDALLEEGSVTAAADRLHLSAPAMSRTLGRIRATTGDQILVRTGRTMTATPYALAVRERVHLLVQEAGSVLDPQRELDLASLERTFTFQCHDALTSVIALPLLSAGQAHAPGVTFRFLAETASDTDDLRYGRVDLELGATEPARPEIRSETLGTGQLVVVLRPGHPLLDGELTAEGYAGAQHVLVSRRGRLHDPVDGLLAERGLRRRVVAAAPTSTTALQLVQGSDTVTTVMAEACAPTIAAFGLQTRPMPFPLPPVPVICAWHQRYDTDPAHIWLRAQVRQTLEATFAPANPRPTEDFGGPSGQEPPMPSLLRGESPGSNRV